MKATETELRDFLKKSPQFVMPIYQRTYSWTEPQCRQLWDDILHAGRGFHPAGYKTFNQSGSHSRDFTARRLYE